MGLDAPCHTIDHDEAAYLTCGADSDCPSGNVCDCDAATCSLGPRYPIIGSPASNVWTVRDVSTQGSGTSLSASCLTLLLSLAWMGGAEFGTGGLG
ncbi:hypothetical protein WA016_02774 [Myxococcus stipitatus]